MFILREMFGTRGVMDCNIKGEGLELDSTGLKRREGRYPTGGGRGGRPCPLTSKATASILSGAKCNTRVVHLEPQLRYADRSYFADLFAL